MLVKILQRGWGKELPESVFGLNLCAVSYQLKYKLFLFTLLTIKRKDHITAVINH